MIAPDPGPWQSLRRLSYTKTHLRRIGLSHESVLATFPAKYREEILIALLSLPDRRGGFAWRQLVRKQWADWRWSRGMAICLEIEAKMPAGESP